MKNEQKINSDLFTASLGSMRQEFSYSKTVSIINDYVDVLANRHEEVHKELMSVKKVVNDNKIDITKHDDTSVNGYSVQ